MEQDIEYTSTIGVRRNIRSHNMSHIVTAFDLTIEDAAF